MKECPCETCITRPTCGRKLIRVNERKFFPPNTKVCKYLVVEFAEQCPQIREYFGSRPNGNLEHRYEKIYAICKIFGATEGTAFVWFANELSIYDKKVF